jgi:hypothetical protein
MTQPKTEEDILNELPAGWTLIRVSKIDGTIEVASDKFNVVFSGRDWAWIKQRMTSLMLSAR